MGSRKGQAAMEYLMTYGWAIVALVIVIAALMATGAFNPSYLIAEECSLQPDLSCGGHIMYIDGSETTLKFRIDNGLGYPILLEQVELTLPNQETITADEFTNPESSTTTTQYMLEQGQSAIVEVDLTGHYDGVKGETARMALALEYKSCAPEVIGEESCYTDGSDHVVSGRIVARVEEAS